MFRVEFPYASNIRYISRECNVSFQFGYAVFHGEVSWYDMISKKSTVITITNFPKIKESTDGKLNTLLCGISQTPVYVDSTYKWVDGKLVIQLCGECNVKNYKDAGKLIFYGILPLEL